jgi:hypothetical protein
MSVQHGFGGVARASWLPRGLVNLWFRLAIWRRRLLASILQGV